MAPTPRIRRANGRGRGLFVAGGSFTPADLTGLTLWLQAGPTWCFTDAGGTVPAGDTDPVRVWKDRSGNGFDFSQATSSHRPTLFDAGGGKWVVSFDGVDDLVENASLNLIDDAAPFVLAFGYNGVATSAKGIAYKDGDNASTGYGFGFGNTDADSPGANVLGLREAVAWVSTGLAHGAAGVFLARSSGTTVRFYKGGAAGSTDTLGGSSVVNPTGGTGIGGYANVTRYAQADLSAVVLAAAENAASQAALESYLAGLQP